MTVTITWEGVLLTLLALCAILLLIYLIVLKVVSEIAADKAHKVDKIVDGVSDSVGTVVNSIKGNQSVVAAATSIINAAGSLAGIVKKPANKEK